MVFYGLKLVAKDCELSLLGSDKIKKFEYGRCVSTSKSAGLVSSGFIVARIYNYIFNSFQLSP